MSIEEQVDQDKHYADLERSIRRKRCVKCRGEPQIAWIDGAYRLRCQCYPEEPKLVKAPNRGAERLAEMVRRDLARRGQDVEGALVIQEAPKPLTIEEFDQRQALIKHVVAQMVEGVHYGIIPGTRDRSLWEPGAEYLRAAFNVGWGFEVIERREDFRTHDYFYRVRTDGPGASWETAAWSKERKFWCSSKECPKDCRQTHDPRGMEPTMMPHNVLDRAIKRGFVALIRNVTGTTGYFKQALDLSGDANAGNAAAGDAPASCPAHPGARFTMQEHWLRGEKVTTMSHVIVGQKGPKGGKVFCEQDEVVTPAAQSPQDHHAPLENATGATDSEEGPFPASQDAQGQTVAAMDSGARKFTTVTAFWESVNERGWSREWVKSVLGGLLGEFLNGPPRRHWDDAYAALEAAAAQELS